MQNGIYALVVEIVDGNKAITGVSLISPTKANYGCGMTVYTSSFIQCPPMTPGAECLITTLLDPGAHENFIGIERPGHKGEVHFFSHLQLTETKPLIARQVAARRGHSSDGVMPHIPPSEL